MVRSLFVFDAASVCPGLTSFVGDMVTLYFMDKNIVVLNSAEAATELLEKRAASTSGRQREVMMGEVYVQTCSFHA